MCRAIVWRCLLLAWLMLSGACTSAATRVDPGADVWGAWPVAGGAIVTVTEQEIRVWTWNGTEPPSLARAAKLPQDICPSRVYPMSDSRLLVAPGGMTRFGDVRSWGDRTRIGVLSLETGQIETSVGATLGDIECLTVSPSGRMVAWCECSKKYVRDWRRSENETFAIRVAEAETLKPITEVTGDLFVAGQVMKALQFSPDERLLAFASHTGESSLGVMDVEAKDILWYKKDPAGTSPWYVAFSRDGRRLFATTSTGRLICFDALSGEVVWTSEEVQYLAAIVPFEIIMGAERLLAVDVSPDGRLVAASTDYTHKVIIWEAESGKRLRTVDLSDYPIEQALFFDPSGKGLWAAGSLDTKLRYFPLK